MEWQWQELPYAKDEKNCIFKTSLTFVDSVSEIWGPLLQGRTLVVVPKHVTKDPERFVSVLEEHKVGSYIYLKIDFLQIFYLEKKEIKERNSYKRKKRILNKNKKQQKMKKKNEKKKIKITYLITKNFVTLIFDFINIIIIIKISIRLEK